MAETQPGIQPTGARIETLNALESYESAHALASLGMSFEDRNREMSDVVAGVSSVLAARMQREEGGQVDSGELYDVFWRASNRTGLSFQALFDGDGRPAQVSPEQYHHILEVPRVLAREYLPDALQAVGIGTVTDVPAFLGKIDFVDAVNYAARQLGLGKFLADNQYAQRLVASPERLQAMLKAVAVTEPERQIVDSLPYRSDGELSADEERAFDMLARLSNAGWMVGETHQAAWENAPARITSSTHLSFQPYDRFLRGEATLAHIAATRRGEGRFNARMQALLRVALNVWKDVMPAVEHIPAAERLVPADFPLDRHLPGHVKDRTSQPAGYPPRYPIADGVTWDTLDPAAYNSSDYPTYTSPSVLAADRSNDPAGVDPERYWADPTDPRRSINYDSGFVGYEGKPSVDARGVPRNPMGPTGMKGRGELGNYGPNFAGTMVVTRINRQGYTEILLIKRKDGVWGVPGGMQMPGEAPLQTALRELGEETRAALGVTVTKDDCVDAGYADDPRNTDEAYIEDRVYHVHLADGKDIPLDASHDKDGGAIKAMWTRLDSIVLDGLYAGQPDSVRRALGLWQKRTGLVVRHDGKVGLAA